MKFSQGFYTHFFIDEAGQASEPETIIPLSGLWHKSSHIILSGTMLGYQNVGMAKNKKVYTLMAFKPSFGRNGHI